MKELLEKFGRDSITSKRGKICGVAQYIDGTTQVLISQNYKKGTTPSKKWFDLKNVQILDQDQAYIQNGVLEIYKKLQSEIEKNFNEIKNLNDVWGFEDNNNEVLTIDDILSLGKFYVFNSHGQYHNFYLNINNLIIANSYDLFGPFVNLEDSNKTIGEQIDKDKFSDQESEISLDDYAFELKNHRIYDKKVNELDIIMVAKFRQKLHDEYNIIGNFSVCLIDLSSKEYLDIFKTFSIKSEDMFNSKKIEKIYEKYDHVDLGECIDLRSNWALGHVLGQELINLDWDI